MPEIREIQTNAMDQRCPACSQGWMRPDGIVKPGTVPMFEHVCSACGYKQDYGMRYPYNV